METSIDDHALLRKLEFEAGTINDDILSDQERKRAPTLISDVEAELSFLDQEIACLLVKREVVRARLSRFSVALAPHKRLPPEILARCFIETLSGASTVQFPPPFTQPSPWNVSQVSAKWRHVAIEEARLWKDVNISTTKIPDDPSRHSELASCLSHVLPPNEPLSISLPHDPRLSSLEFIDKVVIPNLPRLQRLDISLSVSALSRLLQAPPDSLCSLQSVHLLFWGIGEETTSFPEQFGRALILQNTPNLRSLSLSSSGPFTIPWQFLPLPWNQLSTVVLKQLQIVTVTDVQILLQRCFRLEKLHVEFNNNKGISVETGGLIGPCNLPHLRDVHLQWLISRSDSLAPLQLPWAQITTICLQDVMNMALGFEIIDILHKCVGVEHLSLFVGRTQPQHIPGEPLVLPHLKSLKIRVEDTIFIDHLTAPALVVLDICCVAISLPTTNVSTLILRSQCPLRLFAYQGPPSSDVAAFERLLATIPSIHTLRLGGSFPDIFTLECIVRRQLLPHLTILTLRMGALNIFLQFLDALERILERETSRTSVLRNVVVYITSAELAATSLPDMVKNSLKTKLMLSKYGIVITADVIKT